MATKKCTQCKVERDIVLFQKNGKETKTCEQCRERSARSRRNNKEQYKECVRAWKENNKERTKQYNAHYRTQAKKDADVEVIAKWEDVRKEKGIVNVEGQPSKYRKEHVFDDGIEGKICSKCEEWYPLEYYNKNPKHWDGLRTQCTECLDEYRVNRTEKMTEYNKKYWKETKEEQTQKHREWVENNREKRNKYQREYMLRWEKEQRENNPQFKLRKNLRTRLWHALRDQDVEKTIHTFDLIGCSVEELKEHLGKQFEEGMTWENYGEWHVDHIRPCCSFDLTNEEEQKKCFHWSNLQPMWGSENSSKGGKYPDLLLEFDDLCDNVDNI